MNLVTDTREQRPLDFTRWPEITVTTATLRAGDYSLVGFEDRFALERKSLPDLVASVTTHRERFERELQTLRGYDLAAIVAECDTGHVLRHEYRSKASPDSVLQSLAAFQVRYRVPTLWAGSPQGAAYMVRALCRHYLADQGRRLRAVSAHLASTSSTKAPAMTRPTASAPSTAQKRI
ncbi:ERCC4 domain-containing protein [Nitratidesulfovibrio vulgaris]|uniref:ERCC4 domain-containing protein n=1 Tax=Nitratidesulfovibrio vulgaris TaxID=881 RepID=UPI003B969EF7